MMSIWKHLKIRQKIQYSIIVLLLILTVALVATAGILMNQTATKALRDKGNNIANMTSAAMQYGVQYSMMDMIDDHLNHVLAEDHDIVLAAVVVEDDKGVFSIRSQKTAPNFSTFNVSELLDNFKQYAPVNRGECNFVPGELGFWVIGRIIDIVPNGIIKNGYIVLMLNKERITGETHTTLALMSGIAIFILVLSIGCSIVLSNVIVGPIKAVANQFDKISQGIMQRQRITLDRNDEVGMLTSSSNRLMDYFANLIGIIEGIGEGNLTRSITAQGKDDEVSIGINKMIAKLHELIGAVTKTLDHMVGEVVVVTNISESVAQEAVEQASSLETLTHSMGDVLAVTHKVAGVSQQVNGSLGSISASVVQVSANMDKVAFSAEEMSNMVNTVVGSIEDMSISLNDVAKNSAHAATIAKKATQIAHVTSSLINELGGAAREIGQVVDMIKGIASQTNLLALNATIEAASAGEAGKGFAVVAVEVKELAKQTAVATENIRSRVGSMQQNTSQSVKAIEEIVKVIADIDSVSSGTAVAVAQQTQTIQDIARNSSDMKLGVNEVSKNMQQAALGTREVAKNVAHAASGVEKIATASAEQAQRLEKISQGIMQIGEVTQHNSANIEKTTTAVADIARQSGVLKDMLSQFKLDAG